MSTSLSTTSRLASVVVAAVPGVVGVSVGVAGDPATVLVQPPNLQASAQPTIDAFDWSDTAHNAWLNLRARADAAATLDLTTADAKVLRGVALVLIDEVNALRQWLAAFKVEVAAATNLANFQTRVAGLPATPDRTLAQAKTAIQNAINAGSVD